MPNELDLESAITCPACKARHTVAMPVDACVIRLACPACGHVLTAPEGQCCVFCAHGTRPCPPVQNLTNGNCCTQ
ncbi:MAG: hypothetical protein HZA24_12180 [Nitrospirae bacterium]|nr:hypothetical protein [Nitrospirota bacterium]